MRWVADRGVLDRLDRLIAAHMEPCDVFIGMSGLSIESALKARKKYGATVFIERGSRHIVSQKTILDACTGSGTFLSQVPIWAVQRELASYRVADTVVVPSRHVCQSFVEEGFDRSKLFLNPYGVDLAMFPPTLAPPPSPRRMIMVGTWCRRKGCDVLTEVITRTAGVELIHVGALGDLSFPASDRMQHVGPVQQARLVDHYARAHVAVLPSREEGLALVIPQALACGVPVVCSDRTGGEDLQKIVDDPTAISVFPAGDALQLERGILGAFERSCRTTGIRDFLGAKRELLSWRAYGARYARRLMENTP